jgi:hypothetical protein
MRDKEDTCWRSLWLVATPSTSLDTHLREVFPRGTSSPYSIKGGHMQPCQGLDSSAIPNCQASKVE